MMEYWWSETLQCWLLADERGELLAEYTDEEELLADHPEATKSEEMGDD